MNRPTAEKKQRVTLYLPADLIRRARHAGLDADRSLSDLAREGLEKVLVTQDEPLQRQNGES